MQTTRHGGALHGRRGALIDVPAARHQLTCACGVWGRLRNVIAKESVPAPLARMFYQAVVAGVLLYGSESWVLPDGQLWSVPGD